MAAPYVIGSGITRPSSNSFTNSDIRLAHSVSATFKCIRPRLEEAESRNHPSDFDGEMQSFSRLLRSAAKLESVASLWPLIEGMLNYIARSEFRDFVWVNFEDYLLIEVERDPVKAIQIFRLMHDQIEAPHYYYRDEAHKIIKAGLQRAESRHETLLLIEQITGSGNYSFRTEYEKYVDSGAS